MEKSDSSLDADMASSEEAHRSKLPSTDPRGDTASGMRRRMSKKGKQSIVYSVPDLPPVRRPRGLGRADIVPDIPFPEHTHLPGWTKRMHLQAEPILQDIAGQLGGEAKTEFLAKVSRVVGLISEGKFSQARLYQTVIDEGFAELEKDRKISEAGARTAMALSTMRRRLADDVRNLQGRIGADQISQLQQSIKTAETREELMALQSQVSRHAAEAQSGESKRRQREISRTREKILHLDPGAKGGKTAVLEEDEGWQATLRKFALDNGIVAPDEPKSPGRRS